MNEQHLQCVVAMAVMLVDTQQVLHPDQEGLVALLSEHGGRDQGEYEEGRQVLPNGGGPLCGNWAQPQSGTEFLSLPWEEWPVSRESASELPSDDLIIR